MICCEDYELAYALYHEGKILEATNEMLSLKSLTESVDVLTEGFKENISAYIDKIVAAIQRVWDKFKDNVLKAKLNWKSEDIQKAINEYPAKIQVEMFVMYDPSRLDDITIQELNFSMMRESLASKEDFLKKYYSSFYTDSSKSVVENLENKCITQRADKYNITKDDLQTMFDYMKIHKDKIDKIGKDLQAMNRASRNAKNITVTVAPRPSNESVGIEYYLREGEDDPKVQSTDNNGSGSSGDSNNDQSKEDLARVQNYFKATTEILSAEMTLCREIYKYYEACINTHMKNSKANQKQEGKTEKPAQQQGEGGSDQVNI